LSLSSSKSQKFGIFGKNFRYKFFPKKKSSGSSEKLEYRSTTRNLPLCNDTI